MKVSDAIILFLKSKGIDTFFTVSGGGCIHLIESLRTGGVRTYCVHHEQSALMAAEGFFRTNGKIAGNIVTTGPGGTNALTGLLGLWLDSIPSIVISGQVSSNQLSENTGCRQIGDQEFDICATVKNMTKYAKAIKKANDVIYELEKAYHIATSGRPGPVWIDVPLDIQASDINMESCPRFNRKDGVEIDDDLMKRLEELISQSKRPLVIAGNGINLSQTQGELFNFLKKSSIPIVTGPHSGVDCVDNTITNYSGRIGILGQLSANHIVQEADLLICLGTRLPVKMTGYNIKDFSPKSKKVMVDIDENEVKKHPFKIDLSIIGDLRDFFKMAKHLELKPEISEWLIRVKSLRGTQQYFHKKHEELTGYASFYYLISKASDIFKTLPIVTSNGTAHVVTLQNYRINKNQKLFTNVGCASMGYGLPAAIGSCIAAEGKVICIEGDGSIMMNLQELQTVVGYNLPIKIIIINNEGYLSIKMTQESFFKGNEFASGPKNGVTLPDYKKIADAFGIQYHKISENKEIDRTLRAAIESHGPCIIEVFTHPKERHEPKVTHKGIDNDGKIIPGSLTDMYISDSF